MEGKATRLKKLSAGSGACTKYIGKSIEFVWEVNVQQFQVIVVADVKWFIGSSVKCHYPRCWHYNVEEQSQLQACSTKQHVFMHHRVSSQRFTS